MDDIEKKDPLAVKRFKMVYATSGMLHKQLHVIKEMQARQRTSWQKERERELRIKWKLA